MGSVWVAVPVPLEHEPCTAASVHGPATHKISVCQGGCCMSWCESLANVQTCMQPILVGRMSSQALRAPCACGSGPPGPAQPSADCFGRRSLLPAEPLPVSGRPVRVRSQIAGLPDWRNCPGFDLTRRRCPATDLQNSLTGSREYRASVPHRPPAAAHTV